MKKYLNFLAAFLIAPMFGNAGFVSASVGDLKPNIIFILTDDQGYGDLGCYGSETIATPNIDKLCAEGMKFESFFHETFIVPAATIRHGNWKLLVKRQSPGGGRSDRVGKTDRVPAKAGSLFNLQEDLGETTDLSAQHPRKVQELTEIMNVFMEELKANSRPVGTLPSNSDNQLEE